MFITAIALDVAIRSCIQGLLHHENVFLDTKKISNSAWCIMCVGLDEAKSCEDGLLEVLFKSKIGKALVC